MRAAELVSDQGRMVARCLLFFAGLSLLGHAVGRPADDDAEGSTRSPPVRSAEVTPKSIGETCSDNSDCIPHSICDGKNNKCECSDGFPVNIKNSQCLPAASPGDRCVHTDQCIFQKWKAHCEKEHCVCNKGFHRTNFTNNNTIACVAEQKKEEEAYVDPTMIGVLVGLSVMFVVMCVVLRMFSKARFTEHRTIFNSPRLMKLSLANKRAERRPSHASVGGGSRPGSRAGSRHASIASGLNMKTSPTNSQKGSQNSLQNHMKGSPVKQEPLIKVDSPKDDKPSVNIADKNIASV